MNHFAQRIGAKAFDLCIAAALGAAVPTFVGPVLGFFYSIGADGLPFKGFEGQSIGKKIFGLSVWNTDRNRRGDLKDSLLRNAPVGVATFFAIIPVWGWLLSILVGLPLLAIELTLMFRNENHHRIGDAMADTEVRA